MPSILYRLSNNNKVDCPAFLIDNIHYETIMGSHAYGCNNPESSDLDVYGFCIPPLNILFPHTSGFINGYDQNLPKFEQYQSTHLRDEKGKVYDINCYNIVKYFRLCADCNPNMVDSLFTASTCVLHTTKIGTLVRDNRKLFLSKKAWHSFRGYAFSQLSKATSKKFESSKRKEEVEKYGYSVKYAYHLVRLMDEVEQILLEGDIDLQRNREHYKAIRKGEFTLEELRSWFDQKEKALESLYLTSKAVPHSIREEEIKELLINCLEEHYGSLDSILKINKDISKYERGILDIASIIKKLGV